MAGPSGKGKAAKRKEKNSRSYPSLSVSREFGCFVKPGGGTGGKGYGAEKSKPMKRPWFQMYGGDWRRDPELSRCADGTRGIWADAICAMQEECNGGRLSGTVEQLARVCRTFPDNMRAAIEDLRTTKTADVEESNGVITLINRRLAREFKESEANAERQQRFRDRDQNNGESNGRVTAKITPMSQPYSSSSSESKKDDDFPPTPFLKTPDDEPDEKPERERLPNPAAEFEQRLRERHGDRVSPEAIIQLTVNAMRDDREEFNRFLDFEEKQSTAPQKLRNPGGYYRRLIDSYRASRSQAKQIEKRKVERDLACVQKNRGTESPPKTCALARCDGSGEVWDETGGHACGCEAGKKLSPRVLEAMEAMRKPPGIAERVARPDERRAM